MNKLKLHMLLIICFTSMAAGSAMASSIVIDGDYNAVEWSGSEANGDGTLAPGGGGQAFDVEYLGMKLTGDTLYFGLQTGFDLVNGAQGFRPGDIALDTNNDGTYDYAIDFSINGSDQVTFSLYENPEWVTGPYPQHGIASPFETTGGDLLASFGGGFGSHYYDLDRNVDGGISYVLEGALDLSLLSYAGGPVGIHWAMGCENDYLNYTADQAPVSEPATMFLMGSGLLGLAALGRRRFKVTDADNS